MRSRSLTVVFVLLVAGILYPRAELHHDTSPSVPASPATAEATRLLDRQPGFFVPNLGQWDHAARFVHRSGSMTVLLQERGWVLDLQTRSPGSGATLRAGIPSTREGRDAEEKIRGVALQMTFEGNAHVPVITGEEKLSCHHDYFFGEDESRWRTDVPLYRSVRYEGLYPGIDLRLREANGVPEYDLLLEPGSDLASVHVHVDGVDRLSIAEDGSLVMETALGTVTQPVPMTWEVRADGSKREVACRFQLLDADRFGFVAPDWDGATSLTIDPGLIWSSFLGGQNYELPALVSVDSGGVMTVAGQTGSTTFPTTVGAYDRVYDGGWDVFVSRLDPSKTGASQLVYSTYLGGPGNEVPLGLAVDPDGVVSLSGYTTSNGFPTTSNAFDATYSGGQDDAFVTCLDPSKSGSAQLAYSTFFGGSDSERAQALAVDVRGVLTVTGYTVSCDFPTTTGAYDTTYNGPTPGGDAFVSRLDPSKSGSAQLVYSTFLGGTDSFDGAYGLSVDTRGVVTVAGGTGSRSFPTTSGAYDSTLKGTGTYRLTAFVSRLDPSKTAAAQLVYSTYLGGTGREQAFAVAVDASGVATVAGWTNSPGFPTTSGAYDRTISRQDVFVSRLDPSKTAAAQLVYSTFLGGPNNEDTRGLFVDANGVVTLSGWTTSSGFPTTSGAFDTSFNGGTYDAFVSRLDPRKTGSPQLVYSTFLGGPQSDDSNGLFVDASGVATVSGWTRSSTFPTTSGAYDTTFNSGPGISDAFVSRLDMGVALYGDVHEISIQSGGSQRLTINAGKAHANRLYWVFGSVTGTTPGINLLGVHIPLNPDVYTDVAISQVNTPIFANFRGTLDTNGLAAASFNVPANSPLPAGFSFYHGYVVYDATGKFYMASNAVPVRAK